MSARRRFGHEPAPHDDHLVLVNGQQFERLGTLTEHLIELRDLLDGDVELDEELHDGAALFPDHPAYGLSR